MRHSRLSWGLTKAARREALTISLHRQTRYLVSVGLAISLASLFVGCDSKPDSSVELGGDPGALCVPVRPGDELVLGEVMKVVGSPISIEDVSLVGAESMRVVNAYLVSLTDSDDPIMSMLVEHPVPLWSRRESSVKSSASEGEYNVLVQVERVGLQDGSAESVTVSYRDDFGRERSVTGTTSFQLKDSCD